MSTPPRTKIALLSSGSGFLDGLPPEKQEEHLKSLKCPACQEIPPPPIQLCSNGHHTCSACRRNLRSCPVCSAPFTSVRSLALEAIVSLFQIKCPNPGCPATVTKDRFKSHVNEKCEFRPVLCYCQTSQKCNGNPIGPLDYEAHLKEAHGSIEAGVKLYEFMFTTYEHEPTPPDRHWSIHTMKQDGKLFLLNYLIQNGTHYYWVSIGESKEEAYNYEVTLTVMGDEKQEGRSRRVPAHSYRDPFDQVKGTGHLVRIPEKSLLSLAVQTEANPPPSRGHPYYAIICTKFDWRVTVRISRKQTE